MAKGGKKGGKKGTHTTTMPTTTMPKPVGSGGPTIPAEAMFEMKGAGDTRANGFYQLDGEYGGKPQFRKIGDEEVTINWDGGSDYWGVPPGWYWVPRFPWGDGGMGYHGEHSHTNGGPPETGWHAVSFPEPAPTLKWLKSLEISGVTPQPAAEEAEPPLPATWSAQDVHAWARECKLPEGVAEQLLADEVDGETLLGLESKREVKESLGLPLGKAAKLWDKIVELRTPHDGGATAEPTLILAPQVAGSEAYMHADSLLRSSWQKKDLYEFVRLVEVQEIKNPPMSARYEEYKRTLPDAINGNEQLLFHGCSNAAIASIAKQGFVKDFQTTAAGSWQRFGPGFYFATAASKSHEYPLSDMQALQPGQHFRKMILCRVAKGNVLKTSENMDKLPGRAPEGYHSVHGEATTDGPLNFDEVVVYNEAAILPYAVVTYEFVKHQPTTQPAEGIDEETAGKASTEMFVVKETGQILSVAQLFDKEIAKSQCWTLAEAVDQARARASEALPKATDRASTFERRLASIEAEQKKLEQTKASAEESIRASVARLQASITDVLQKREADLLSTFDAECSVFKDQLNSQHTEMTVQHRKSQRLCEGLAVISQQTGTVVVRTEQSLSDEIAAIDGEVDVEAIDMKKVGVPNFVEPKSATTDLLLEELSHFGTSNGPVARLKATAEGKLAKAVQDLVEEKEIKMAMLEQEKDDAEAEVIYLTGELSAKTGGVSQDLYDKAVSDLEAAKAAHADEVSTLKATAVKKIEEKMLALRDAEQRCADEVSKLQTQLAAAAEEKEIEMAMLEQEKDDFRIAAEEKEIEIAMLEQEKDDAEAKVRDLTGELSAKAGGVS